MIEAEPLLKLNNNAKMLKHEVKSTLCELFYRYSKAGYDPKDVLAVITMSVIDGFELYKEIKAEEDVFEKQLEEMKNHGSYQRI